jgi:uncharacterized membrane protein YhiD involved in acid resistance
MSNPSPVPVAVVYSPSPVTQVLNHLSETSLHAALVGGIGYLCGRLVQHIGLQALKNMDPRAGLACGAAVGAVYGLTHAEGANLPSKIVGIAALFFVPFKVCQRFEIPITFNGALLITGMTVAASCAIFMLLGYAISKTQSKKPQEEQSQAPQSQGQPNSV